MIGFDIELADVFELAPSEDFDSTGSLDRALAHEMLHFLRREQKEGRRIVAWNGPSFDLKWMGHAAGLDGRRPRG